MNIIKETVGSVVGRFFEGNELSRQSQLAALHSEIGDLKKKVQRRFPEKDRANTVSCEVQPPIVWDGPFSSARDFFTGGTVGAEATDLPLVITLSTRPWWGYVSGVGWTNERQLRLRCGQKSVSLEVRNKGPKDYLSAHYTMSLVFEEPAPASWVPKSSESRVMIAQSLLKFTKDQIQNLSPLPDLASQGVPFRG